VGEIVEALHVVPGAEIATALAFQFEEGGDWPRAVKYLLLEADTAGRRFESRQAVSILEHARELVSKMPEAERAQSEIAILQKLAAIYSSSYDLKLLRSTRRGNLRISGCTGAHCALVDVEVCALLGIALPMAWVGADRYVEAVERAFDALQRSGEGDL